jgi:hypothetical protein
MVRNTTGGSKTKSQARKSFSKDTTSYSSSRTPQNEFERMAIVQKLLGNGMCYVSIDGFPSQLICHIRGKFRGRSKKHNIISVGSTVLVGLRDWESPTFKNTDLLELLSSSTSSSISSSTDTTDNILFTNDIITEEELETETTTTYTDTIHSFIHNTNDTHFNFDDI